MNEEQLRTLIDAAVRNSVGQEWWYTTVSTLVAMTLVAGIAAFAGAWLRPKGQNLATKQDIDRLTFITKEIEQKVKGRADFLGSVFLERYHLVRDLDRRLENIRYDYERVRKGNSPERIRIVNGETLEATEALQLLDLNEGILGEKFHTILMQKYNQVILLHDPGLDWESEMRTWRILSSKVQKLMEEEFGFNEAKLPKADQS